LPKKLGGSKESQRTQCGYRRYLILFLSLR